MDVRKSIVEMDIQTPSMEVKSPQMGFRSPSMDLKSPKVGMRSPMMAIKSPKAGRPVLVAVSASSAFKRKMKMFEHGTIQRYNELSKAQIISCMKFKFL